MARSLTQNANPFGAILYGNTALNATADTNVRGGGTLVYQVTVDNTANVAPSYVQLFNNAAPTVGTTPPDMILWVAGSSKRTFTLDFLGTQFGTALSLAATTTPTGSTNPSAAITVFGLMT